MTTTLPPRYTRITGTGSYLPPGACPMPNWRQELAERGVETSDPWIVERTGIRARHFADAEVCSSDLALAPPARPRAAGLPAADIDLIIVATSTPDMVFPSTACIVQNKLGIAKRLPAFDVQAVCSGFVYALTWPIR
jgi:3-oxoacyl-[acyl-carrier-protein] synthase-3